MKHLSDLERFTLSQMCEENGPAELLRFIAAMLKHEAADLSEGDNIAGAILLAAKAAEKMVSRF